MSHEDEIKPLHPDSITAPAWYVRDLMDRLVNEAMRLPSESLGTIRRDMSRHPRPAQDTGHLRASPIGPTMTIGAHIPYEKWPDKGEPSS